MGKYVGGNYQQGKLYCAFCGEYRNPANGEVVTNHAGRPICPECGYQIRLKGRYWHRYNNPKRY
jgi:transposase-like protein